MSILKYRILLIGVYDIRILLRDYSITELVFINLRLSDVIVLIVFTWYLLKIILPAVMLALGLDARYRLCSLLSSCAHLPQGSPGSPDLSDELMMI